MGLTCPNLGFNFPSIVKGFITIDLFYNDAGRKEKERKNSMHRSMAGTLEKA